MACATPSIRACAAARNDERLSAAGGPVSAPTHPRGSAAGCSPRLVLGIPGWAGVVSGSPDLWVRRKRTRIGTGRDGCPRIDLSCAIRVDPSHPWASVSYSLTRTVGERRRCRVCWQRVRRLIERLPTAFPRGRRLPGLPWTADRHDVCPRHQRAAVTTHKLFRLRGCIDERHPRRARRRKIGRQGAQRSVPRSEAGR